MRYRKFGSRSRRGRGRRGRGRRLRSYSVARGGGRM